MIINPHLSRQDSRTIYQMATVYNNPFGGSLVVSLTRGNNRWATRLLPRYLEISSDCLYRLTIEQY